MQRIQVIVTYTMYKLALYSCPCDLRPPIQPAKYSGPYILRPPIQPGKCGLKFEVVLK